MASVQFRDLETILRAYRNRNAPGWAIFQGKQFMFTYAGDDIEEGASQLEEIIKALHQSAAIYTLCVYEDVPEKIKSNTPFDGSFNFRLNEYDQIKTPALQQIGYNPVMDELKKISDRLEALEKDDDEDPEPGGIVGQISEIMSIEGMPQLIQSLISGLGIKTPAAIAGVEDPQNDNVTTYLKLCELVPELPEKINILYNLSQTDNRRFKSLLTFIKFIK